MTARRTNAWLEAALEFGRSHQSFVALDPRTNPKAWTAWRDYFRWLNWAPQWFLEVERQHDQNRESPSSWTAPIDHPDRFTIAFQPVHGHPPVFPMTLPKTFVALPTTERIAHVNRVMHERQAQDQLAEEDLV